MSISNENYDAVILLTEIHLQCKLIERSAEKLHEYAAHWIALEQGIDNGKKATPIDIVAACVTCLSAAASIRSLLFVGDRKGKKVSVIQKRCNAIMALLGQPKFPILSSNIVRNSWEHLDERLDELLSERTFRSLSDFYVSAQPPNTNTFVLRQFDPVNMEIRFGNDAIALEPCINEAKELLVLVNAALKRLHHDVCQVY